MCMYIVYNVPYSTIRIACGLKKFVKQYAEFHIGHVVTTL